MIRFESEFYSKYKDSRFKVTFFQSDYEGIDATVTGGSGKVYYLNKDWTDYLEVGQEVIIQGGVSLSDIVLSFTYNDVEDRTEVTLTTNNYSDQTRLYNDINSLASFVPTFSPMVQSLETEWEGQGDEVLAPIKSSYTDLVYSNRDEDSSISWEDNEWFGRFVDDWNLGNDRDSKVIIYKHNGVDWDLQWAGRLVPDLLEWENFPSPRNYTFRINDGIETLKDVPYDGDINNLDQLKMIDVFKGVLSGLDLEQFWGNTDDYIFESIEYKSDLVTGVDASDSPLDYTYVTENMFIERDAQDEVKFISQYDVLKACLEIFSARFSISKGAYRINQIRNFDTESGYTARVFNKLNNTYSAVSVPHKVEMDEVFAGGTFGYFEGLRRVYVSQETNQNALLPIAKGVLGLVTTNGGSTTYPNVVNQSLGELFADTGAGNCVEISMDITNLDSKQLISDYYLDVAVEITSSTFMGITFHSWIKGDDNTPPYWGNGLVVTDRYWGKRVYGGISTYGHNTNLVFKTPPLPYNLGDARLDISFSLASNGSSVAGYGNADWFLISNVNVNFPTDENDLDTVFSVENDYSEGNYTKDLELDKLIIKENTTVSSINTLMVDEDYNSGGGSLVSSTLWDGDFDGTDPLARARVIEAMSLQFRPIEKYLGGFRGELFTYQTIDYNNKVYAMNGYRYDYSKDEYNGEWFEVATARAGLSGGSSDGKLPGDDTIFSDALGAVRDANVFDTNKKLVYTINNITTGGAVSSFSINGVNETRIKEDDTIQLIDASSKAVLEEFEVSSDYVAYSGIVYVTSKVISTEIIAGALVQHKPKEVVETNISRARFFDSKENTDSAGSKEGRFWYDWTNEELKYNNSSETIIIGEKFDITPRVVSLAGLYQNNYDTLATPTLIVDSPDSILIITGFNSGNVKDGHRLSVVNQTGTYQLQIDFNSTSSSVGNRIDGNGSSVSTTVKSKTFEFVYSNNLSKWVHLDI